MTPLKPGDRVRAYGNSLTFTGRVTKIKPDSVYIIPDGSESEFQLHPKQCRKLKPKAKRRSVWVNVYGGGPGAYAYLSLEAADRLADPNRTECVEFVEVRGKRK